MKNITIKKNIKKWIYDVYFKLNIDNIKLWYIKELDVNYNSTNIWFYNLEEEGFLEIKDNKCSHGVNPYCTSHLNLGLTEAGRTIALENGWIDTDGNPIFKNN